MNQWMVPLYVWVYLFAEFNREHIMIIDCHYHLDPRIQSLDNLLLKMDQYEIEKTALMAVLCDPVPHTREPLLKLMRFCLTHGPVRGLAKKFVARFTPQGDVVLPQGPLKIYPDPGNQAVADALTAHPDRFVGWIFVNPRGRNDPIEEFERFKDIPGFIGIKAHPFWHQYPPQALVPIARRACDQDMPLLIHAGFDGHGDFLSLLDQVPGLKLILAHSGFPKFKETWCRIKDLKNVWVDLSADAYVDGRITREVVEFLGPDRCLFGTDGPYGNRAGDGVFDNGFIKRRLVNIFPDQGIQKRLLGENFMEIISWK